MPRATIDRTQLYHHDLTTLDGGFVKLRQLSYSEMMARRDIASKMAWESRQNTRGAKADETVKAVMEAMNKAVMEFEFKNCIVEHNLEDADGNLLDFSSPKSYADLDPKIGAEIDRYITELNEESDAADLNGSGNAATQSSLAELIGQESSTDES